MIRNSELPDDSVSHLIISRTLISSKYVDIHRRSWFTGVGKNLGWGRSWFWSDEFWTKEFVGRTWFWLAEYSSGSWILVTKVSFLTTPRSWVVKRLRLEVGSHDFLLHSLLEKKSKIALYFLSNGPTLTSTCSYGSSNFIYITIICQKLTCRICGSSSNLDMLCTGTFLLSLFALYNNIGCTFVGNYSLCPQENATMWYVQFKLA